MTSTQITTAATQLIDGFDAGAHQIIEACREGSDRLGAVARERWDVAFKASKAQLSAETRRNATHARDVFAGYYGKAVDMGTTGAEVAVETLVQAARTAVERATAWHQARA